LGDSRSYPSCSTCDHDGRAYVNNPIYIIKKSINIIANNYHSYQEQMDIKVQIMILHKRVTA
ncbi:hypothetical protein, partial [Acinetobacter baumannii]|uniref:hypothetical protein n=1 Tax=Acinetobacter baumannii TaxID=470 RepID=UPI001BA46787